MPRAVYRKGSRNVCRFFENPGDGAIFVDAHIYGPPHFLDAEVARENVVYVNTRKQCRRPAGGPLILDLYVEAVYGLASLLQDQNDVNGAAAPKRHDDRLHGPRSLAAPPFLGSRVQMDFVAGLIGGKKMEGIIESLQRDFHCERLCLSLNARPTVLDSMAVVKQLGYSLKRNPYSEIP